MFNIRIWYDNTIGIEDVPEDFGIMFINSVNIIGCLLDNQRIEDFIIPFVTNIVFQNIGLFCIINSNKNLCFDYQKYCPSWVLNTPWYNTIICSLLHGSLFEDYFTTGKHDKYNLIFSIKAH